MIEAAYYFSSPEKLPISGLYSGSGDAFEILLRIKPLLNELLVSSDVKDNSGQMKSPDSHFYGNYHIGEGTVIYNDVTIIGPVYIGKDCELMPGAIIRPYTVLGDGCSVGHGTEIKRSVMFSGSKAASLAFVGDSILGASARIGSGVITANRKFNQGSVILRHDNKEYDAGDFFGLILGDSARLGANAVTQPGTHIGPHTWVYPMTNIRGFIPREKRVYHPRELVMEDNEIIELKP